MQAQQSLFSMQSLISVTSQRQLDHVFPAAFAGALHNVAKLTARMPAMKDFVDDGKQDKF